MKKFFLAVFVVAISVATLSCNKSDDDGGDGGDGMLTQTISARIDGELVTFNNIIVDRYSFGGFTELDITATISGSTQRLLEFYTVIGDVGSDAIQDFYYIKDGVYYHPYNQGGNLTTVTTKNNGSRLEFSFSGTLVGYNEQTQEEVSVTLESGSAVIELE